MRSLAWEYVKIANAFNKHDDRKLFQHGGGTATFSFNQLTHRTSGVNIDETGMARWSWILLKREISKEE